MLQGPIECIVLLCTRLQCPFLLRGFFSMDKQHSLHSASHSCQTQNWCWRIWIYFPLICVGYANCRSSCLLLRLYGPNSKLSKLLGNLEDTFRETLCQMILTILYRYHLYESMCLTEANMVHASCLMLCAVSVSWHIGCYILLKKNSTTAGDSHGLCSKKVPCFGPGSGWDHGSFNDWGLQLSNRSTTRFFCQFFFCCICLLCLIS